MSDKFRAALRRKESRAFALSWSAALLAGCAVPGPSSLGSAIKNLERVAYTDAAGTGLSYLRAGDAEAPRIIFVHGSPGDASAFADQLVEPMPRFESISIDRPGFGNAKHAGVVTSYEAQARAIEPLLVERGGRWPILVGHSLGGPIIARAAADFPDRVGGIVIIAGSLDPALEELRWFNYLAAMMPVRWIMPHALKASNVEMFAAHEQTTKLAGVLGSIRCPVAIVHGTNDGLVPYANVAYMQKALTNATSIRVDTLDEQGHFLVWNPLGKRSMHQAIEHVASHIVPGVPDATASEGRDDRNHD